DLGGLGKVFEQLRELIKDLTYRNRLENRRMAAEVRLVEAEADRAELRNKVLSQVVERFLAGRRQEPSDFDRDVVTTTFEPLVRTIETAGAQGRFIDIRPAPSDDDETEA